MKKTHLTVNEWMVQATKELVDNGCTASKNSFVDVARDAAVVMSEQTDKHGRPLVDVEYNHGMTSL